MFRIISTMLLVMIFNTSIVLADVNKGVTAFNDGDYPTALQELKPEAKAGNADAQFYLGVMVTTGAGVSANSEKGIKLLKAAADQGHPDAVAYLEREFNITHNPLNVATKTQEPTNTDSGSKRWLVLATILAINLIACLMLQSSGKLIIYRDYTDALLTFAGALLPLVVWLASGFVGWDKATAANSIICTAVISGFFIMRSTYVHNQNIFFALMALVSKLSVIALYVAFLVCNKHGVTRREGESLESFEYRKAEAERNNTLMMVIATAIFLALTNAMTKYRYFAPLKDHISFSFAKVRIEDQVMEQAN